MAGKPDPELDELLDAAAKDFTKPEEPSTSDFDISQCLNPDGSLNEQFVQKMREETQALSKLHLENLLKNGDWDDLKTKDQENAAANTVDHSRTAEDISNRLKELNLFGDASNMDADKGKEFSDAIMGAMQSMRENLSEAFPAARNVDDEDADDVSGIEMENLTNVMQQMMLALLSKDMLLPSFKEISEKFPSWLEENKSKLSEADLKRYSAQLEVMKQIVAELEKEGSEDDKQHLDRMVELMGKAQELGQPPQELTAQLGNSIDDSKIDAMLKDSGADQCNIM